MAASLPFEPTSVRTSSSGVIALWQKAPVAYTRVRGHFCRDHAQQLIRHVDTVIARSLTVEQFHDWGDMASYDLMSQKDLTMWTLKVRRNVKALTILVHDPTVLLGVKLANAALQGMIRVCESRAEFEQVLRNRVAS